MCIYICVRVCVCVCVCVCVRVCVRICGKGLSTLARGRQLDICCVPSIGSLLVLEDDIIYVFVFLIVLGHVFARVTIIIVTVRPVTGVHGRTGMVTCSLCKGVELFYTLTLSCWGSSFAYSLVGVRPPKGARPPFPDRRVPYKISIMQVV